MAPIRPIVCIKLPLPVPYLDSLTFFQNMFEVRPDDQIPVFFMESKLVKPFLIRDRIESKRLCFANMFGRSPPQLYTLKFICNFFMVIHAKNQRLIVLHYVSFESLSL
ncbi:hypothetical protein ES288_A11G079700v1 [Gossypium darwinii]|uniref:Uncharacterized protein n=1 Tax=Gossypium darwinii TaxID=34276 RepID=A0A5D2EJI7_GOSDA|nr:hypothetical protein ES288_A11G079700v1 [Gossypium darwinii]